MKQLDRGLQFCIGYRDVHIKTSKNQYPLPLIQKPLNLHQGAKIYLKRDVHGAYNIFRAKDGDDSKLSIRTWYGLFEPTVMQFGNTNAPSDFMEYINNTIREACDDFVSANLDAIFKYSNSEEEHEEHVQ